MVGAVFGAEAEHVLVNYGCYGGQVGEGHADDYVAIVLLGGEGGVYLVGQLEAFGKGGVHLPVACYDILSHL